MLKKVSVNGCTIVMTEEQLENFKRTGSITGVKAEPKKSEVKEPEVKESEVKNASKQDVKQTKNKTVSKVSEEKLETAE